MARVRFDNQWFDEIDAKAFYEAGFEAVILQNAHLLRPNAFLVPFKTPVEASGGRRNLPDLALIDDQYRFWWVIEVELSHHPLDGHVLPQVGTFAEGDYTVEHLNALLRAEPRLDPERLDAMLRGDPPQIVVITNEFDGRWERELRAIGVAYAVFRIFRSDLNRDVIYFEGQLPNFASTEVTRLLPTNIPRYLRVVSPAALPSDSAAVLSLLHEGKRTLWTRTDTKTDCYLVPAANNPLTTANAYIVTRDDEGRLHLQAERRAKR